MVGKDGVDQRAGVGSLQPPVQPMPEVPVRAVRPNISPQRKGGKRPGVPAPHIAPPMVEHPPAIDGRERIAGRIEARTGGVPMRGMRLQIAPYGEIAAAAVGKIRRKALARLGVDEHIRLVRPLVHGRAAKLGEPDRLSARHPGRRRRHLHPADAIEMRVRPPADQILVAEYPRLAVGPVGDGRTHPRLAGGKARIMPVEALARPDRRAKRRGIVWSAGAVRIAGVVVGVPPVRQRHVVVDADRAHRGPRP